MIFTRTSLLLAAVLLVGGSAVAQEPALPEAPALDLSDNAAFDDPVGADLFDEPAEPADVAEPAPPANRGVRVPLVASGEGDGVRPSVRLVRHGAVVATGLLGTDGSLESGSVPPGVYSVIGVAGEAMAIFSQKIEAEPLSEDASSVRLLAPPSDRALALAILARRFPEQFGAAAGPVSPAAASAAPAPVAPAAAVEPADLPANVAAGGQEPVFRPAALRTALLGGTPAGAEGLARMFDADGLLQPLPGAEIFLIRNGDQVASLTADGEGRYRLPKDLEPGLYTHVMVSSPASALPGDATGTPLYGASVVGLNVVKERPVVQQNVDGPFRTVVRRVLKQAPIGPPGADPDDFAVIGPPLPPGPPGPLAGGPVGGGGGAAGGGGGGALGGSLLPLAIGIGGGLAIGLNNGDDDDDVQRVFVPAPRAATPQAP
ncbi:carboxypeptidase-like regulatory domain-containing protein [Alienimonas californiensis]|uniref:Cna protein B-type domain protein n=1 Tax=Alienimonas californiensis TaxID=2527989 RepID=A0A517PFS5_9PLAN|nr:carboxypeptidase-like regulatory domain-containing protein [Alienimonas californiensis]QDT18230.1 hypothetical protein CA12_43710 [Alienimonas californiensis]